MDAFVILVYLSLIYLFDGDRDNGDKNDNAYHKNEILNNKSDGMKKDKKTTTNNNSDLNLDYFYDLIRDASYQKNIYIEGYLKKISNSEMAKLLNITKAQAQEISKRLIEADKYSLSLLNGIKTKAVFLDIRKEDF